MIQGHLQHVENNEDHYRYFEGVALHKVVDIESWVCLGLVSELVRCLSFDD